MPFQAVPNAASVVIHGKLDGQDALATLGFGLASPAIVTAAALGTLGDGIAAWMVDFLLIHSELYTQGKIVLKALDVETGPEAELGGLVGVAGSQAGNILPNNCSIAVSFKTGVSGRTNRGRNFWAGLLETDVADQRVNNVRLAQIKGMYEGLIGSGYIDPMWVWSVISRKELVPGGPGRAVPITTVSFNDDVVDSQRRRLPGRGN